MSSQKIVKEKHQVNLDGSEKHSVEIQSKPDNRGFSEKLEVCKL